MVLNKNVAACEPLMGLLVTADFVALQALLDVSLSNQLYSYFALAGIATRRAISASGNALSWRVEI